MRKYKTLIPANLRKQKGSAIGLFLLMFIITLSLSCVLCIWNNAENYVREEMDRVRFGDLIYWLVQTEHIDEIREQMNTVEGVEGVECDRILNTKLVVNGKESATVCMLTWEEQSPYKVFVEDTISYRDQPEPLQPGEAYVPISFQSIYDVKAGDRIQIKDTKDTFLIKGFIEDPTCGSTTMGIKNVFICEEDLRKSWKENEQAVLEGRNTGSQNCYVLHTFLAADADMSIKELQRSIAKEISFHNAVLVAYTKEAYVQFMLLLENIFIGLLLAFVVVLLVVTMIVIGHCINSSLELSYTDLGIEKAIGFTNGNLGTTLTLQYLIVLGIGLAAGLPASAFLVRIINSLIVPVTGIRIPARMPVSVLAGSFGLIVLILVLFLLAEVSRIGRISPMTAIRGGRAEVYFASRLQTPVGGKFLQLSLALRQLTSGAKRYVGACSIAALLVFVLSFSMRIHGWLGEDGSGMMNAMGVASVNGRTYDFAISYTTDKLREEVEETIEQYSPIQTVYQSKTLTVQMEGTDYMLNVISEPEYLHILEGRTCRYENEMVVTKMVASDLGLLIGDRIPLTIGDQTEEFLVTGLNQCANDLGNNVTIHMDGLRYLGAEEGQLYFNYQIMDPTKEDALLEELKEKYGDSIDIDANKWSGIDGIVGAANALKILMFMICTIFIFVVVFMTGSKILHKEQHDMGVYKALGFYSGQLRVSFAIRFFFVSLLGVVVGSALSIVLTDPIASRMFYMLGVGSFETPIRMYQMMISVIFVVMAFLLASYLIAGRIKRTDPGMLISE